MSNIFLYLGEALTAAYVIGFVLTGSAGNVSYLAVLSFICLIISLMLEVEEKLK